MLDKRYRVFEAYMLRLRGFAGYRYRGMIFIGRVAGNPFRSNGIPDSEGYTCRSRAASVWDDQTVYRDSATTSPIPSPA